MSYLMEKYKGVYRLKTPYDLETKDFPRNTNEKGKETNYSENDIFIDCNKGQIFYYGRGVLQAYIPKLGVGRNILKKMGKELGVNIEDYTETKENINLYDYEGFYKKLKETTNVIFDIEETDSEVLFKFKNDNMEIIAKYLEPRTSGAKISPFSVKNLPKNKYDIPAEDLKQYKDIASKSDKLKLAQLTRAFISNTKYKGKNIKDMQKQSGLKGKEFIHSLNLWDKYLEYLLTNC